jgi:DNA excision repair protein ERCC-5
MGVKDLWQLVAPIGRRVSIETLEGKTLAIDVSIWIIQFIKVFLLNLSLHVYVVY